MWHVEHFVDKNTWDFYLGDDLLTILDKLTILFPNGRIIHQKSVVAITHVFLNQPSILFLSVLQTYPVISQYILEIGK